MLDFLYRIDLDIFYFINHTLANPLFDKFFPFVTEVKNWYIAYLILFLILIIKGGRIGRIAALLLILLIITTDQFSSFFFKNLVHRIRPCNVLPDVRLLVGSTQSFSFPSSHGVNNFAVATYFYRIFPKLKWPLFIVATLMAFSRPYVGVHYPSDVIGGALIGVVFGYIFSEIVLRLNVTPLKNISTRYKRIKIK